MSTICAIATAQGGAIGVIRTSGEDAINITDRIFYGHRSLKEAPPYSLSFGEIRNEDELIDEVLVSTFRAPHSYTGEDCTEISCHGSQYILQRIVELLVAHGCRLAKPGEYTQRAFLNGKMDLSQAEAVADLISSNNKTQHKVAISQMRGGISQKLSLLREKLLKTTSLLVLELDFSEEDVEFADRKQLHELICEIDNEIVRLSSSFEAGNAIKNGIPVAIVGAPNVGKSTLLNLLLKDDRAIVSDIQGTTRDIIEDTINIQGVTFRFIDTAGIRNTEDSIEQLGIERTLKAALQAQIIIMLTEPGVPFPDITPQPNQQIIYVTNKTADFQAINGTGLQWLLQQLLKFSLKQSENEVLVTSLRHKQALDLAHKSVVQALTSIQAKLSGDLIAEDLRQCLNHLGEILGSEITPSEVLQNVFQNFCIGK